MLHECCFLFHCFWQMKWFIKNIPPGLWHPSSRNKGVQVFPMQWQSSFSIEDVEVMYNFNLCIWFVISTCALVSSSLSAFFFGFSLFLPLTPSLITTDKHITFDFSLVCALVDAVLIAFFVAMNWLNHALDPGVLGMYSFKALLRNPSQYFILLNKTRWMTHYVMKLHKAIFLWKHLVPCKEKRIQWTYEFIDTSLLLIFHMYQK